LDDSRLLIDELCKQMEVLIKNIASDAGIPSTKNADDEEDT